MSPANSTRLNVNSSDNCIFQRYLSDTVAAISPMHDFLGFVLLVPRMVLVKPFSACLSLIESICMRQIKDGSSKGIYDSTVRGKEKEMWEKGMMLVIAVFSFTNIFFSAFYHFSTMF